MCCPGLMYNTRRRVLFDIPRVRLQRSWVCYRSAALRYFNRLPAGVMQLDTSNANIENMEENNTTKETISDAQIRVKNEIEANVLKHFQVKRDGPGEEEEDDGCRDNVNFDIDIHYNYDIKREFQLLDFESDVSKTNETLGNESLPNNHSLKIEDCASRSSDWSSTIEYNMEADFCNDRMEAEQAMKSEFCQPNACSLVENENNNLHTLKDYRRALDMEKNDKEGKVFVCSLCGKKCASEFLLKKHSNIHSPSNLCPICGKLFSHPHNMSIHMRVHSGERPFECTICKWKFPRKDHLKRHMDTHTGVKPHKCSICDKTYRRSTHLNRHRKSHTGEKPYHCVVCNKMFSDINFLKRHQAAMHKY
ncbi:zinc finger protein 184 isoform X2 [Nilaparvata lugens]|uniref:zinc finger protein 184 isoform X2 n=1 Tax=Nilaparvata lugens TaxID=108931 RepID=UPI00193D2EF5|nr:zinc finger protein 184 isoform X2 [Nilaparvata lugens]